MVSIRRYTIALVAAFGLIFGAAAHAPAQLVDGCGNGTIDPHQNAELLEECDHGQLLCDTNSLNVGQECATDAECFGGDCSVCAANPASLCTGPGDGNRDDVPDACRSDCTLPICGDGVTDPGNGEECDDGNGNNNDVCLNSCELAECGDGTLCSDKATCTSGPDLGNGRAEICDDGNVNNDDGCNDLCIPEACGDGIVQSGEECDDGQVTCAAGSANPGQPCDEDADCFGGLCGTGAGGCDALVALVGGVCGSFSGDPNRNDLADHCRGGCTTPSCGDGITDPANDEECDDGNDSNNDGCTNECNENVCGDGFLCSENNPDSPCTSGPLSTSGGVSTNKELCDDGNVESGDGCSPDCVPEACGDGFLNGSDECDNGQGLCAGGFNPDASCSTDAECFGPTSLGCTGCRPAALGTGTCNGTPGPNRDDLADQCRSNCVFAFCGDGVTDTNDCDDPGNCCDDGNSSNNDGCTEECLENVCGDGFLCNENNPESPCDSDAPFGGFGKELCDDGNLKDGDGCSRFCMPEACGDGVVEGGEQCDNGFAACADGFAAGQLCNTDADCGPGAVLGCIVCVPQELDPVNGTCNGPISVLGTGTPNLDDEPDQCRSNCMFPSCGDGVTDTGEGCDDGNVSNNDTCLTNCNFNTCGDGHVCSTFDLKDPTAGGNCTSGPGGGPEECDDGNTEDLDACDSTCALTQCGDTIVQEPEECDLGQSTCSSGPFAGQDCDSSAECFEVPGACQGGNLDDAVDSCRSTCVFPSCGDGVTDTVEACDDGGNIGGDFCTASCLLNICGDGDLNPAVEQCDDGNTSDGDGCSSGCTVEVCGDGITNISFDNTEHEECDAGIPLPHPTHPNCTRNCCLFGGIAPVGQPSSPTLPVETFADIHEAFDSLLGCHTPKLIATGGCHTRVQRRALKIEKLISEGRSAYVSNNFKKAIRKLRRAKRQLDRVDRILTNKVVDAACSGVSGLLSDQKNRIAAINNDVQNVMPLF